MIVILRHFDVCISISGTLEWSCLERSIITVEWELNIAIRWEIGQKYVKMAVKFVVFVCVCVHAYRCTCGSVGVLAKSLQGIYLDSYRIYSNYSMLEWCNYSVTGFSSVFYL